MKAYTQAYVTLELTLPEATELRREMANSSSDFSDRLFGVLDDLNIPEVYSQ